jgi:hypothetical protein
MPSGLKATDRSRPMSQSKPWATFQLAVSYSFTVTSLPVAARNRTDGGMASPVKHFPLSLNSVVVSHFLTSVKVRKAPSRKAASGGVSPGFTRPPWR